MTDKAIDTPTGTAALQQWADDLLALTSKQRTDKLKATLGQVDGESLGKALTAASQALMTIHQENPDLMNELGGAVEKTVASTDFGKLRYGIAALSDYRTDVTLQFLKLTLANPVVLANLATALPPVINNQLRTLSFALANVDLPGEILASSLFNILADLDTKELVTTLNAATALINDLHEGNMILGGDEPRFKAVFTTLLESLLENLDIPKAAGAVVALGEDTQVMSEVWIEQLSRNPELTVAMASTLVSLKTLFVTSFANFLQTVSELPDEVLAKIGQDAQEQMNMKEVGHMVDAYLTLYDRLNKLNPELSVKAGADFLAGTEGGKLGPVLAAMTRNFGEALKSNPATAKALEPEQVGQKINGMLVRFNHSMQGGSGSFTDYLRRMFGAIDGKEMEKAFRAVLGGLTDALFATTDKGMAVIRPVMATAWKSIRFLLGSAKRKLIG